MRMTDKDFGTKRRHTWTDGFCIGAFYCLKLGNLGAAASSLTGHETEQTPSAGDDREMQLNALEKPAGGL